MALSYTSVDRMVALLPDVLRDTHVTSSDLYGFATDAEAIVAAKLAERYELPIAGDAPLLGTIATDIAIYRLLTLRLFTGETMNDSPWPDRYRESLDMLNQLGTGTLSLVSSGEIVGGIGTGVGQVWSNTSGFRLTFTERPPEAQQVDPTKYWRW